MESDSTKRKPWIDEEGNPCSSEALKIHSTSWSAVIWEEYLLSTESRLQEAQTFARTYDRLCEEMTESIFATEPGTTSEVFKSRIASALSTLTKRQAGIIRLTYWEELSEREIAKKLFLSRSTVNDVKRRALKKIKNFVSTLTAIHPLVRGECDSKCVISTTGGNVSSNIETKHRVAI